MDDGHLDVLSYHTSHAAYRAFYDGDATHRSPDGTDVP